MGTYRLKGKGTYGEQQRNRGYSGSWTDYSKQRVDQSSSISSIEQRKVNENSCDSEADINQHLTEPLQTPLARDIVNIINKNIGIIRGYVYFKEWNVKGCRWYKIGITNNPKRRDAEQNVLPVPPKTLAMLDLNSMDLAKAIETSLHDLLEKDRIKDAQNRELFELEEEQVRSIQAAFESFANQTV